MSSDLVECLHSYRKVNVNKQRYNANDVVLPSKPAKILRYWNDLRGDAFAPTWGVFKIDELPVGMIPWSMIVDVEQPSGNLVYRFWGTARVRYHGEDLTGMSVVDAQDSSITTILLEEYKMVTENCMPLYIKTECENLGNKLDFEFLRLPLSSDGQTVDKIYCVGFSGEGPEGEFMEFDSIL